MILFMLITLYTSRVILKELGVTDYGIYNLVGGLSVSFSIFSSALSGAISRFITFELGKDNSNQVQKVFGTAVFIQLCISVFIIIIGEIIGLSLLNTTLNIPEGRLIAAKWLYQFTLAIFIIKLLSVPFEALIISNEKMSAYAYFSIIEVILQLLVAFVLKIITFDKLIIYGAMLTIVAISYAIMLIIYCRINLRKFLSLPIYNKDIFKSMIGFANWNFIGTSAGILKNYGTDIIINIFLGVKINAARGIATQINNAVTKFTQNFMTALQPQIIKSYANGDKERNIFLIERGARFSFYLLLLLSLPLILEMNSILKIWLNNVPEYAEIFGRLILIDALTIALSQTLTNALLATGKIKYYQIVVGGITLLNLPLSYLLLYLGAPAEITYVVAIIIDIICLAARLIFAKFIIGLSIRSFFNNVIVNTIIVAIVSSILPISLAIYIKNFNAKFIVIITSCILSTMLSIIYIGIHREERKILFNSIHKFIIRKGNE